MFYLCRPDEGYSLSIILILCSDIQTQENTISHVQSPSRAPLHARVRLACTAALLRGAGRIM